MLLSARLQIIVRKISVATAQSALIGSINCFSRLSIASSREKPWVITHSQAGFYVLALFIGCALLVRKRRVRIDLCVHYGL